MSGITGTAELRRLAAKLREVERKDLQSELDKGIRKPVKPLEEAVVRELAGTMPKGYAATVAGSTKVRASIRTRGRGAGISVVASAKGKKDKRDLASLNAGNLRHPRWGDRRHWYVTSVRPGFFKRPGDKFIKDIHDEVVSVIERIARKIEGA